MAKFQPPPTWAEVIVYDEVTKTGAFNPIWLKWFVDLVGFVDASGVHNSLTGLQGGTVDEFYHLTAAQHAVYPVPSVYTPTLTNVANLDSSTAYQLQFVHIGSVVFVAGKVDADPTAPAALTQLGISLPVASNFGAIEDCGGAAAAPGIAGQSAAILADAANNRAQMEWISGDITNQPMFFTFGYQVI